MKCISARRYKHAHYEILFTTGHFGQHSGSIADLSASAVKLSSASEALLLQMVSSMLATCSYYSSFSVLRAFSDIVSTYSSSRMSHIVESYSSFFSHQPYTDIQLGWGYLDMGNVR